MRRGPDRRLKREGSAMLVPRRRMTSAGFEVGPHEPARMGVMGASLTGVVQACIGWSPSGHRVAGGQR
jgi:hypothetical protein